MGGREIGRGAEAVVSVENDRVVKERISKGYRHPELDRRIRKERTDQEKRLLEKASRAGVAVPEVLDSSEFKIEMERIEGEKLREVFEDRLELCSNIGKSIARLHSRDIIHGDLTTSNMIFRDGKIYFIDFGLGFFSQRIEDRATDLRLLWQVLESSHFQVAKKAFGSIIDSYSTSYDRGDEVLDRLDELETRARYK
ncbi:MAG: KEOPS complex kinase/ATPase Bud32 [Candidatus Nanohaloarchaea archaeon]|nr:KEOPS complex kinase/ATPase Bud32 [Candidatus Nanohaloarchaea archaeon]